MENPFVNYQKIINDTASKHFNVADVFKDNSVEENIELCKQDRLPFSVGLLNITGCLNTGIITRTSLLLGASELYLFGRRSYDKRSCVGSHNYIPIHQRVYENPLECDDEVLSDLKNLENKYEIVLCELGGYELTANNQSFYNQFKKPPLFIFGSESHGLPTNVMDAFSYKVSVPQRGVLRSYNVSTAASIILFDYVKTNFL
jgi:tRNA G18 (ribose-2'-O)-methylase SpoU